MASEQFFVELDVCVNEADVKRALRCAAELMTNHAARPDRTSNQLIVRLVVGNFDRDKRELRNITEAADFFRMVVRCGWYGLARYPQFLGMRSSLQPGCSEEKEEFWTPIMIGWCPDGVLLPEDHKLTVLDSWKAFALVLTSAV